MGFFGNSIFIVLTQFLSILKSIDEVSSFFRFFSAKSTEIINIASTRVTFNRFRAKINSSPK